MASMAMGLIVSDAYSVSPPPPPDPPPAPVLTAISISGSEGMDEGTSAQYVCTASYSDNTTATVSPSWSEDSIEATINSSGVLSVGNINADQTITVTADYSGKTAVYMVSVADIPPVLTGIVISGPSSVNEETTAQFVPDWSENSSFATISASGVFSALNVSADAVATITASFNGETDTHAVTIRYVAPLLTSIAISGPSSVNEETTAQYVCTASYSDGSSSVVVPNWSENSSFATISSSGVLEAGDVASDHGLMVTASFGGKSDTHALTIHYVPPTLEGITISGQTYVDEESSALYVCTAIYSDGTSEVVVPGWSENSSFASINVSGYLVTGDVTVDQGCIITAIYGGKQAEYAVTINFVAPPVVVTSLTISGPGSLEENTTIQYVCTAYYSDGTSGEVNPTWSEDSTYASISGSGLLTAGNLAADEQLTVRASFDGKTASKTLVVIAVGDQVIFPLSGFNGKTVSAELWDDVVQTMIDLGEEFEPEEIVIENVTPNQWYWLGLREYDAVAGEWILVHGRWFRM